MTKKSTLEDRIQEIMELYLLHAKYQEEADRIMMKIARLNEWMYKELIKEDKK